MVEPDVPVKVRGKYHSVLPDCVCVEGIRYGRFIRKYFCGECRDHFPTASSLLKHFVKHVLVKTEKKLPDLVNIGNGEEVNPMKYCLITMEENDSDKYKESSHMKNSPTRLPDLKPIIRKIRQ